MVTIEKTGAGLYMSLSSDPLDREAWSEFLEDTAGWSAVQYEFEFIDELIWAGIVDAWESEPGLTEAPAFWLDGQLYAFMGYQIWDLKERLDAGHYVFWERGDTE